MHLATCERRTLGVIVPADDSCDTTHLDAVVTLLPSPFFHGRLNSKQAVYTHSRHQSGSVADLLDCKGAVDPCTVHRLALLIQSSH